MTAWPYADNAASIPRTPYVRGASLGLTVLNDVHAFGLQVAPVPYTELGAGIQMGAAPRAGVYRGVQLGILSATGQSLYGLQISAINNIDADQATVRGVQIGLANGAGSLHGFQVGAGNRGQRTSGFQIGIANISDTLVRGGQVGPINWIALHKKSRGCQLGGFNLSEAPFSGLQIGLFNSCRSLKGVQLGLFNRVTSRHFLWGTLPFVNLGW